ncbi:MAG: biotin carboxylase N-terminal domain-containing protein [Emticicia sp.]|nr:biotin carboxylase N-terminal domain-containing protein [Emticicia sp.]
MIKSIRKILIANRGEIAVRVMRTAREMGIKTVAVFSEADRNFPHVKYADEVVCIVQRHRKSLIFEVIKSLKLPKTWALMRFIPGYGFLSENADFSEKSTSKGLDFHQNIA